MIELLKDIKYFVIRGCFNLLAYVTEKAAVIFAEALYFIDRKKKDRENK